MQHRAAFIADAPAMSGKRRAAAQKIAPGHAASVIAQACSGRLTRRQLGKVDRMSGAGGKTYDPAHEQTCCHNCLHPRPSLFFGEGPWITAERPKGQRFVRRTKVKQVIVINAEFKILKFQPKFHAALLS
jgi:hypothetical protein